jgi:dihydroorotate dehydrogenase electron transfer subunit
LSDKHLDANNRPAQGKYRIVSQDSVMPGVHLVWFEAPDIARSAKPGQFVMVHCGSDTLLRRPFSIYQTNKNKEMFAILYATVGKGTEWLSEQLKDSYVDIFGPLGNGFTIKEEARDLLLLSGGLGIAPLNFLAIEAQKRGLNVNLRQGAKTMFHVNKDEYEPARFTITTITEDGSSGEKGLVIDGLSKFLYGADQVFACGPLPMYQVMAQMPELVHKPVQVSLEVRMACGIGACLGCTIRTKTGLRQVCKDGPVFNLNDIVWEEVRC